MKDFFLTEECKKLLEEAMLKCEDYNNSNVEEISEGNCIQKEAYDNNSENKINDRSQIKWQTGMPNKTGKYLITTKKSDIDCDNFIYRGDDEYYWEYYGIDEIIAWCPLSEIKPYKK